MTASHSSDSGSVGLTNSVLTDQLVVSGYRFTSATTPSLAHGENCDIVHGYRITNRSAVVAKASTDSLRFEREFFIMKKLYQYKDGPSYIVRPLEYINMPSGLTVVIYADEGTRYLQQQQNAVDDTSSSTVSGSEDYSSTGTSSPWIRQRSSKPEVRPSSTPAGQGCFDESGSEGGGAPTNSSNNLPSFDLCTFLRFAIKCCSALDYIHKHNCTHGEISLQSFQWDGTDEGPVKLWSFGSGSKSMEQYLLTSEGWRKTSKSKRLMSMLQSLLVYMSPEQTGRTTYTPDHRSDIYSLGIVFFIILTSRNPFDGGPLEILNSILSRKVPLIHELQLNVPEVLSRIIEKMTNKAPDDRYTSAHGIRTDLQECLKRLTASEESSSSEESIPAFPLAQYDVASVFTLPKSIYGRQDIISEMTFKIERCAGLYKPMRLRSINSNNRTKTSSTGVTEVMRDVLSDDVSDEAASNGDGTFISTTSPSRCSNSGVEGSDVSSMTGRLAGTSRITATVVGVYGPGGIGKSTLLSAVQPTARKNGYIATSKFDSRNKVPYSAVLKSLSQILQQILSESEDQINAFYEHIKLSLGAQYSNIAMITDYVPELKPLLNRNDDDSQINLTESVQVDDIEARRTQFHNLYVELIRAITRWRMTTLFLDDLHQADVPSLEILESLMTSRVKILMFMSYRDEEVTPKLAELLENKIADVSLIGVNPISTDALIDFVCDTLHRPRDVKREDVLPLVETIYKKTQGNAFYIAQLLRTLERKRYIYFDWENNEWSYDLQQIEDAAIFEHGDFRSDTQLDVSFIVARLRELPPASQALLKWASFVGDTFSWTTVKSLMLDASKKKNDDHPSSDSQAMATDDGSIFSDLNSSCGSGSCGGSSIDSPTGDPKSTSYQSSYLSSPVTPSDYYHRRKNESSKSSVYSGSNDPISGLQTVLQEGYIMPVTVDEFKWSHDRISQAAAELANPNTRNKIHLTIAQHMMKESNVDAFLVADHLLKCQDLIMALDDRQPYRKILILAGDRGRSSGALSMAYAYYTYAIRLAKPELEWTDEEYKTSLQLYCNAASLSWAEGDLATTEKSLKIIFENARSPLDRLPAYRVQSRHYMSAQIHSKARLALLQAMDELGNEVSKIDDSEEGLQRIFAQTQQLIEEYGHDKILSLSTCDDTVLKAMMDVMNEYIAVSYFSGQKGEMLYWSCRLVILTITHGPTSVSGSSFVCAGLGFATLYKKYEFSETISTIGIALAEKYGSNQDKGRAHTLYMAFVRQWSHHLHDNLTKHVRPALQYAKSAGDQIYATGCQAHIAITMFYCGHHVADTLRESEEIFEDIHSWSQTSDMNSFVMCIVRACKALQGHTYVDTPNVFDGDDGFSDEHFILETSKHSDYPAVALNWYESYKMIPLTIYGHYDAAVETGHRCFETMNAHPNHRHIGLNLGYYSLALIEKARNDPENRQKYVDQVNVNQDLLHEWAVHSRINYAMYWTLVEAELASLGEATDILKAARLYEEAISQAREGLWYLELCIIHEYTGAFYHRIGFDNVAYGFIKKATRMYMSHGSYGKVRHLNNKFADLISSLGDERVERHEKGIQTDPMPFHGQPAWSTSASSHENIDNNNNNVPATIEPYNSESIPPVTTEESLMTLDILDMASILKSSNLLSSEVKFDKLLTSMLNIILDNSGANCVAIIIKDDKFGVCAYGEEGSTTTYDPPLPLSEKDKLVSSRIVHHTINTGESIFIYDVEEDSRFAVGPWFEETGRKSVICMPIVHKCTIVGCLLIEGTIGVFTQRHVTVLSLLCQQMGISITNAFLFKSVQRVTMSNMRMIEMQKQALEDARKSKEAADRATRLREIFLANMSHEIRTPFAGFYGMISLLADTKLDAEQRDLVRTAKESCEMLLQLIDDLLNFSKLQAGKVTLDLAPVVVEELVADVIEMLIAMAIQKRINITYTIADDVPAVVIADGNRLRQVIINLLGNAIKFTHEGEIMIRCSLRPGGISADNKVPLLFEVIDSGIGISKEQRKALFVPFSQVDGSTTRKYGGTGLGLSICLQLVTLMSGKIDVSSEPSKGSRFFFTVSAIQTQEQAVRKTEILHHHFGSLKGTRVLVADKHESTVTMVQKLLPGIIVDGVCSVDDLHSHQAADYPIIIVGLFLTHDPKFKLWATRLKKFLERAKCIIVMHYPTGALSDMLMSNANGRKLLAVSSSTPYDEEGIMKQQQQLQDPATDYEAVSTILHATGIGRDHNKDHQAVVRMPVPIRRKKLVKVMTEMLVQQREQDGRHKIQDTTSSSIATQRKSSASQARPPMATQISSESQRLIDSLTPEELALFKTQNILAAEDNPVARKLLHKQLSRLGFNVVCAVDGLEAVEAWKKHPPGYFTLSILDHHMPQCDGVEATKRIRKAEKERKLDIRLPIVTLTADIQESARELCMNAGFDEYLTKPMSHVVLVATLRRFCCNELHKEAL
ncbi:hypothetical protein BDB00DRAFT_833957 [Zychaea mexicana]|uniref:uncharacterized protein n=1 Tax=Zychaea mexicana TaxID=64656 RepID=UPI0022FEEAA1|nr:uncharacterized protein BDB00DRAFT_833957 [Zychaea mexicana]KAI9491307.1 hypothetical protein BDB00DRAFT_833957 [Zychaea mexicana]